MPLHVSRPGTRPPPTSPAPPGPAPATPEAATGPAAHQYPQPPHWRERRASPPPGAAPPRV
eukprot:12915692-Prorocentrum_lima.AAC.1